MKKKLIYAVSLPIVALSLASCSGTDYMSHDFDVVIPEKDSKATNEYDLSNQEDYDASYGLVYGQALNAYNNFSSKYSSTIFTEKEYNYDNDTLISGKDTKRIIDFTNNSVYCYGYYYEMENGEVSSYSKVESKSFVTDENTYTISTEITLNNYNFGTKRYPSQASGNVKIVTTHKEDIEQYRMNHMDTTYFYYLNSSFGSHKGTLSSNDDFSYVYHVDTNGDFTYTTIGENGLWTYFSLEEYKDFKLGYTKKYSRNEKMEYFENSVLNNKYDTKDYIEYDESILFRPSSAGNTFFNGIYSLDILLGESQQFRSWFTITE